MLTFDGRCLENYRLSPDYQKEEVLAERQKHMKHEVKHQELNDEQLRYVVGGTAVDPLTNAITQLVATSASKVAVTMEAAGTKTTTQAVTISQTGSATNTSTTSK